MKNEIEIIVISWISIILGGIWESVIHNRYSVGTVLKTETLTFLQTVRALEMQAIGYYLDQD